MKGIKKLTYMIAGLFLIGGFLYIAWTDEFIYLVDQDIMMSDEEFLVIAHRGASAYAPEHTIESYRQADELGADYLELDLQMTKDNEIIVMHDDVVDRTTDGTGKIKDLTLEEIKTLDAGSWFNQANPDQAKDQYIGLEVPTLEEVLQEFGSEVNYYIETKNPNTYPGMEEALMELLTQYDLLSHYTPARKVIIQSFSLESLALIHEMDQDMPLILLQTRSAIAQMDEQKFKEIAELVTGIGPNFAYIDRNYIQSALRHNLLIHPYNVNSSREIRKVKEIGATGVFTSDIKAVE